MTNEKRYPIDSGWYYTICVSRVRTGADGKKEDVHEAKLLYWNGSMWLNKPRSFEIVDKRSVVDWQPVPDEYDFVANKCDRRLAYSIREDSREQGWHICKVCIPASRISSEVEYVPRMLYWDGKVWKYNPYRSVDTIADSMVLECEHVPDRFSLKGEIA